MNGARGRRVALLVASVIGAASLAALVAPTTSSDSKQPDKLAMAAVTDGELVRFEPNLGQADEQVSFLARGDDFDVFLTPDRAVFVVGEGEGKASVGMRLVGATSAPTLEGTQRRPGVSNYLTPARGPAVLGVPGFAGVRYADAYPGIDLVFRNGPHGLEYDFIVAPGVDPATVRIAFDGADALRLDSSGSLLVDAGNHTLRQEKPVLFQDVDGKRRGVSGQFEVTGPGEIGFQVGDYDSSRPLVIDPVIGFSTYLGGRQTTEGLSIAIDGTGNVYVAGRTESEVFPTTPGTVGGERGKGGGFDVFVTKFDPAGSMVFSTYVGGRPASGFPYTSGHDAAEAIAVDHRGAIYITGPTSSRPFLPQAPSLQKVAPGGTEQSDVFVLKLSPDATAIDYSVILGGSIEDSSSGIAVDRQGNAYISGTTQSADFPVTAGSPPYTPQSDPPRAGVLRPDAFVAKINPSGSELVYSRFLGGAGDDLASGIAVDGSGAAFVVGETFSSDFPTTPGVLKPVCGGCGGAFESPTGSTTAGSKQVTLAPTTTYHFLEAHKDVAISGPGIAPGTKIVSVPNSTTAELSAAATETNSEVPFALGDVDAFVVKLRSDGSDIAYATYLGGDGADGAAGVAIDTGGGVYLTGTTTSRDLPASKGAQRSLGGKEDAFVAKVKPGGTGLDYMTYVGGSEHDVASGIAIDGAGAAFVVGRTSSNDFPTADPVRPRGQRVDAFVAKISPTGAALPFASYLGGAGADDGSGVAVDNTGAVSIVGSTSSDDFPLSATAFQKVREKESAFVTRLLPEVPVAPVVTAVEPLNASPTGGTPVKITGAGLSGATVRAGDAEFTGVTVNAAGTELLATAPAHDPELVTLTVQTAGGRVDTRFAYAEGTWEPTANLLSDHYPGTQEARGDGATFTALPNGTVLVTGGADSDRATAVAELYDPVTGQWSKTASMSQPRQGHTATVLGDGRVLVTGGFALVEGSLVTLTSAELYDPGTGKWTAAKPMNTPRTGHTATLLRDGSVLVAGGRTHPFSLKDEAETYDAAADAWTVAGDLGLAREGHTATLLNDNRVLVTGGLRPDTEAERARETTAINDHPTETTEIYDPVTRRWTAGAPMNAARSLHTSTRLNDGRILVAGGEGGYRGGRNVVAERYDPVAGTWQITSQLQVGRTAHAATLLPDGRVLLAGGTQEADDRFGYDDTSEVVDPDGRISTFAGILSRTAGRPGLVPLSNGKILLVGGTDEMAALYAPGTPTQFTNNTGGSGTGGGSTTAGGGAGEDDPSYQSGSGSGSAGTGGTGNSALNSIARTGSSPLGVLFLATLALLVGVLFHRAGHRSDPIAETFGSASPGPPRLPPTGRSHPPQTSLTGMGLARGDPPGNGPVKGRQRP